MRKIFSNIFQFYKNRLYSPFRQFDFAIDKTNGNALMLSKTFQQKRRLCPNLTTSDRTAKVKKNRWNGDKQVPGSPTCRNIGEEGQILSERMITKVQLCFSYLKTISAVFF